MIRFLATKETTFFASYGEGGYKREISMLIDDQPPVFVLNLTRYPNDSYRREYRTNNIQRITNQLIKTKGRYCSLDGLKDPFVLLNMMIDKNLMFARDDGRKLKIRPHHNQSFIGVSGNLQEYSCAFHFRFYSEVSFNIWLSAASKVDGSVKTNCTEAA